MTDPRYAAELAADARAYADSQLSIPYEVRSLLPALAEIAESVSTAHDAERGTIRRIRRALSNHPRCDVHPDEDAISCGWKRAVAGVQAALDSDRPTVDIEVENARLHRDLAEERDKHMRTAEMLEIALQDAAAVLGIDEYDLGDTDIMEKLASAAEHAQVEQPAGTETCDA
ncbi:hypothetical protein ACT17_32685 [Mycolicibacterium conceptionense]|uniref:Uncharacterized protein n=1 Tax=Mycolicibacterium conceptionense TaxID=451644 RepID=A0A0J8WLP7_9MYCO|nr:hypothetical protein [Mycolicibacterium conceptionense]KMV13939.1 hypothetical protein ACT17_32685 [Mycolicibacterium conceptionense]